MTDFQNVYVRNGIKTPYEHQKQAWGIIQAKQNLILAAGTGAGKTESVLLPAIAAEKRVILVYPTKALLQDQIPRVVGHWQKTWQCSEAEAQKHVSIDTGDESDATLFRADVILTTIDKLLYRIFGYGSGRWGYIYPWRIVLSKQRDTLLVFDEAHAYDEIPLTHFLFIIDKLTYQERIQTAALSATLPTELVEHLQDKSKQIFPREETGEFFQLILETTGEIRRGVSYYKGHLDLHSVVERAIRAYREGKQVIIVVNQVYTDGNTPKPSVQSLWKQVKEQMTEQEQTNLLLYHGHQFPSQRRDILNKLRVRDRERKDSVIHPYIFITTSAFEVGVDVSCDVMFTEICNPDAFVQRIGRCARRSPEVGEVFTFGNIKSGENLAEEEQARQRLLDILKSIEGQKITDDIKAQIKELNIFDPNLLSKRRNTITYTADTALYDYVYDFVVTGAEFWKKGVLVTRDWVPTMEVQRDGAHSDERLHLPVTHPVPDNLVKGWWFEARDVDGRPVRVHGQNVVEQLRAAGIEAYKEDGKPYANGYQATLVLWLKPEGFNEEFGLAERRYAPQEKPKFAGLGIVRRSVKVRRDAPSIFWFEPASREEA